jgi:hypothetical protein
MEDDVFLRPTAFLFGAITPNDARTKLAEHQRRIKFFSDGEAF